MITPGRRRSTDPADAAAVRDAAARRAATWRSPSRPREASVEQVLAAVRAAGVHIKDLRTEDPDLEDVFLALTYGAQAA